MAVHTGAGDQVWLVVNPDASRSLARASRNFDLDLTAVHLNLVARHAARRGWTQCFAAGYIKVRSVSRTGDHVAVQFAFGQRPTAMRTRTVDGEILPVYVK